MCATYTPGTTSGNCLLRGIGGDYSRATTQVAWQTKYVDPIGEVWRPFMFARASGEATELNTAASIPTAAASRHQPQHDPQLRAAGVLRRLSSASAATGMPGVGVEYRYPFVANSVIGQQVIEPIAQVDRTSQ